MVKAFAEFGLCFSSGGRPCPGSSPSIPNGKILGTTRLDGQYSRPSTFYQQLQTLILSYWLCWFKVVAIEQKSSKIVC